jgi:ABC-type uncharacterized transport system involved in gliding motility auxiliary subunit
MLVTDKTKRQVKIQNTLFLVLLLSIMGVLAWLSTRYSYNADWTASGRNTLSDASISLLDKLKDPISITSYAREDETVRQSVSDLIARYQRHKHNITLKFVNPDLVPDKVRELGISVNGELVIDYQGRKENLKHLSERGVTNTLQRLARSGERWLVFLDGHGERKPHGKANFDLGSWVQQLEVKGFKAEKHNLAKIPRLPDNTRVLVIAGPQVNLLPGEVKIINQYVKDGGNLLWLADPGDQHGLRPLANTLGLSFLPGMIVDPTTQALGVSDPRFALVAEYPSPDITGSMNTLTLFPQSVGLKEVPPTGWTSHNILRTEARSWSETGKIAGSISFNKATDIAGPLTLGIAMTRPKPSTNTAFQHKQTNQQPQQVPQQRVVVIGDGDFLSNAYLGNGGNLILGMNLINWLSQDDEFIDIPAKIAPDRQLQLSPVAQGIIGFGFLFVIPLALAGGGILLWWRRRKR